MWKGPVNDVAECVTGRHQANVGRREQQERRPVADQPRQEAANDLLRQLLARGHALPHRGVFRGRLAVGTSTIHAGANACLYSIDIADEVFDVSTDTIEI